MLETANIPNKLETRHNALAKGGVIVAVSGILQRARETPDAIAVVHNGVSCSYAHFARRIAASRQYLSQQQLPVGTIAIVDVQHMLDAWVVGFALRSLGMTTLAVGNAADIERLDVRNVGCVVTAADEHRPAPEHMPAERPARSIRIPPGVLRADTQDEVTEFPEMTANPGGHIMMTSGTTGTYKKIVRDAHVEALALPLHAKINDITGESVVYIANFGPWTAGGYRWPLITWSVGGTVVIHQQADAHSPLAQHDMTHIFATPGTLGAILRAPDEALRRNDATRLLVTGGALSQAMLSAAKQRVTRQVYAVLASTEALTVAVTPLERPDDLNWHRIHPSREVQVIDDAGNVLGPGSEGLIRIRIIDGLAGYLDDDDATRTFFRDGYFHPGDVGMFGDDGRLSLRGRESDVINLFGDKIATGPIEQALRDRLGVEGVCMLAVTNAQGGDEIFVVIQSSQPLEQAEIDAAGKAELRLFRRVPVRAVSIEKFPRNEMGKIERRVLKRQLIAVLADKARNRT